MTTENQLFYRDPQRQIQVWIKREDLIHPLVSGNKFRKLKYNLMQAGAQKKQAILTFGGAFSNHIAAVSAAAKQQNLASIGIIRGEEIGDKIVENPTLAFAAQNGMQFKFVSRETYRLKDTQKFIESLKAEFGDFYLLPEGGTNALAVKGCEEILTNSDREFDFICCAVGTGGTIAGIINSSQPMQKVLGFPALKGDFLNDDIRKFATQENWELILGYDFGGYAKVNRDLIRFINDSHQKNQVPLDPVYTGKMVFGVMDLIRKDFFREGAKILMIHTGGLQGIPGMNQKLQKMHLPILTINV